MKAIQYDYERVKDLKNSGRTVIQIAAILNCAPSTIYRILKFNGKQNFVQMNRAKLKADNEKKEG